VITDSGGLQEETTALGIPCLTVRHNTERPVTITEGTNRLVPDPAQLVDALAGAVRPRNPRRPEGWDGHAGERIIRALQSRTA
jgi:UDP-N-acetylglucosamine 2-epimerase (non-hydrolysing)